MKTSHLLLGLLLAFGPFRALGQGTAFMYQGYVTSGGVPLSGSLDFRFRLASDPSADNFMGEPFFTNGVAISNGFFTTVVDFGNNVFVGSNYWLELSVAPQSTTNFTILNPPQMINPVPYAMFANGASNLIGTLQASQLSGVLTSGNLPTNAVFAGIVSAASFSGNGAGLTNLPVATNGVIAGVPTIIASANLTLQTNGNSPFSGWTGVSGYALTNTPYIQIMETPKLIPAIAFGYLPCVLPWQFTPTSGVGSTGRMRVKMIVNGTQFGLNYEDQDLIYWRTDHSVWNTINSTYSGNCMYATWTWPDSSAHTIELEMPSWLIGIYCPITNSFVNVQHPMKTCIVVGDSITDGAAGLSGHALYCGWLQDYFEADNINIIPSGVGGSGYSTNAVAESFAQRFAATVLPFTPDWVLVAGGINDPTNTLFQDSTNYYKLVQSELPNTRLLVVGPWPDQNPASGDQTNASTIISNAIVAAGNILAVFPEFNVAEAWVTGFYGQPNSGTAPIYMSGNGPHPSAAGHFFYANMLRDFLDPNFRSAQSASSATAAISTNAFPIAATPICPTPTSSLGFLWNSNNALYWVTTTTTNHITGP